MTDFDSNTKKPLVKYFGEGVYPVTITKVDKNTTDDGKEYFEFTVAGTDGEEGTARVWWTEKAKHYSFNTVKTIFVHNTVEKNKQLIRDKIDSTKNTDELFSLMSGLIGKKAWYKVERTGTTYTNGAGEIKNSYNRNIYGYEPRSVTPITDDSILDDIKASEPLDLSSIPF